jgi:hypothetical protein
MSQVLVANVADEPVRRRQRPAARRLVAKARGTAYECRTRWIGRIG